MWVLIHHKASPFISFKCNSVLTRPLRATRFWTEFTALLSFSVHTRGGGRSWPRNKVCHWVLFHIFIFLLFAATEKERYLKETYEQLAWHPTAHIRELAWSSWSILKEINLNIHWKDWCWSSNTLATWCEELTHWKRSWCWGRLKARGEGDDRGWDGWMASPTPCMWVWASSGRQWKTAKTGMLQPMGTKKSDGTVTEQQLWISKDNC